MGNNASAPKVTPEDRAILDLKLQRDKIKGYQRKIQVVFDRETAIAKDALAQGNKTRALTALRQRKYQEKLLSQADSQLATLQRLVSSIEFALVEKDILFGLKQGNDVLKRINAELDLDKVEKLMSDTDDNIAYQQELNDVLSRDMSLDDEDAINAELDALREKKQEAKVSLPSVPDTKLPSAEQPEAVSSANAETIKMEEEEEEEEPSKGETVLA